MSAPAPGAPTPVVLVVDDDSDVREALSTTLESFGYEVRLAENGAAALRLLRGCVDGRPPDVILLDLMMPVMDGVEFRQTQLGDPAIAGVPVVVLSGHGQVARNAEALGIETYCEKPIDLDSLLRVVGRFAGPAS